jgi:hypothetical protein
MNSQLRIGMVGLDTSHCIAFARILQDPSYEFYLGGASINGAVAGGSAIFSLSRERVAGFTATLTGQFGIQAYTQISDLVNDVDAMMLLSADGRQHLEEFRQMAIGKPVFIDKPLATSTQEAVEIISLAEETHTPILSCSSIRYSAGLNEPLASGEQITCCESFGPATTFPDYPGLFWYGIHAVDTLFSRLGPNCLRVKAINHPKMDIIVGEWTEERMGVFRGTRFHTNPFGYLLHTDLGVTCRQSLDTPPAYYFLMLQVLNFFNNRHSPISTQEMLAVIAFIEAAHQSYENENNWIELKL